MSRSSDCAPPRIITKRGKRYALDQSWAKGGMTKVAQQYRAKMDRSRGFRACVHKVCGKYYLYTNRFL